MAGVRGRSGPPGNLNNTKHPWRTFWRRRALKPSDRWISGVLTDYMAAHVSDLGNEPTAGEQHTLEIAATARGCTLLILQEAQRQGFIVQTEDGWDLAPGAKELAKFLQVERAALQAVGLGRRAKQLPHSLADALRLAPEVGK